MDRSFQYFSFNKVSDWEKGWMDNLDLSRDGITLNHVYKYALHRSLRMEDKKEIGDVADVAVDSGHRIAILNEQADLLLYDVENDHTEVLFHSGHRHFSNRAKIALSGDLIYVADDNHDSKITAYSISNGQTLWELSEIDRKPIQPLAIAVDRNQSLYVLCLLQSESDPDASVDSDEGEIDLAVAKVGRNGIVLRTYTHDMLAVEKGLLKRNRSLSRFHLTISADGRLYVLDTDRKRVNRFAPDGVWESSFSITGTGKSAGMTVDSKGQLYIGQSSVRGQGENRPFLLVYDHGGRFIDPISGTRLRVDKLMSDANDRLFVQSGSTELVVYERMPRTLPSTDTGMLEGVYYTRAIDSTSAETVWHKFQLDADIPEETQIRVSYFASDSRRMLLGGEYRDLDEWLLDEHMKLSDKEAPLQSLWSKPVSNSRDALFFDCKGQYLWLKIEWFGSEYASPRLRQMRVYYPRMSYLSYLPAVYQEQSDSGDFLERFLSLFGTLYDELENKIDGISRYFDVEAVSGPFLKWLAGWVGLAVDDRWEDEQIRRLLKRSPDLFRAWGTRHGMEDMIEICTGDKPYIIEHFQAKSFANDSRLRQLFERLYGDNPYSFCVIVKPEQVEDKRKREMIERIIREQKPAFTECKLVVLQPWMFMDMHTYLGLNTYLSEPSLMKLDNQSSMPHHTVIIDVDRDNRLGVHTRLELDSGLE